MKNNTVDMMRARNARIWRTIMIPLLAFWVVYGIIIWATLHYLFYGSTR
jgi:hypothetical protein